MIVDVSSGENTSHASVEYRGNIEDILGSTLKEIADNILHMESNWETKELISIAGSPDGAVVNIDDKRFGNTPINNKLISQGVHAVRIEKSGYRDFSTQVNVELNNPVELSYDLIPISKWYIVKKSLLIPGSGQRYSDYSTKGNLFTVLETLAVAGMIGGSVMYYNATPKYDDAYNKYKEASGHDEILFKKAKQQYDDVDLSSKIFTASLGAAVGIYLLNILDVVMFSSGSNHSFTDSQIRLHSLVTNGMTGISMSVRF